MDKIKQALLIACFMGIISTMINIIAPGSSLKKHLISVLGIIALLAVLDPFAEDGFRLTLDDISLENDIASDTYSAEEEVNDIFFSEAAERYNEYFTDLMNKNDIRTKKTVTSLEFNAEGELFIKSIRVILYDTSQGDDARKLIWQEVPETEIIIEQVEDDGTDEEISEQTEKQPE
ncbi:hypothetical protein [Ruminococcus sp.]|uniref:hypothetical protein n=1 Tax=Ruminococcus sp. TaxID=41978 RepID=UPI0025D0E072|nr:hypothetical protein [Ruminococcus sp.]MBQ8965247.1 hypothetical protein [Ruminococcus sp.]